MTLCSFTNAYAYPYWEIFFSIWILIQELKHLNGA